MYKVPQFVDLDDSEEKSHCPQISERRYEYEEKQATEKGLIDLGKKIAVQQMEKQNRINKFNEIKGVVEQLKSNGVLTRSQYKKFNLSDLLINLYDIYNFKSGEYKKEIELLKSENQDSSDMIDNYINDLDEAENKLSTVQLQLVRKNNLLDNYIARSNRFEKKIRQLSDEITIYKKHFTLVDSRKLVLNDLNNKLEQEIKKANLKFDTYKKSELHSVVRLRIWLQTFVLISLLLVSLLIYDPNFLQDLYLRLKW